MRNIFRFLIVLVVFSLMDFLFNAVLPFSQAFKQGALSTSAFAVLWSMLCNAWICVSICYIAANGRANSTRLIVSTITCLFLILSVLPQIETLYFHEVFSSISRLDVILIMLSKLIPLSVAVIIGYALFKPVKKEKSISMPKIDVQKLLMRVVSIGLIYIVIYFVFGYFIAWKSSDVRVFYSGSSEDVGFFGKLAENWSNSPSIYLLQLFRGILFAVAVVPLLYMPWVREIDFVFSVVLIFIGTAAMLIIPNFLFPDAVRWRHFVEMLSSMTLFALITAFMLYGSKR